MKYLLILSLLMSPLAYAHEEPQPILPPVGTNDNHNNDSDNLKHTAEVLILTGAVVCIVKKCWSQHEEKTVIKFRKHQGSPNENQP